MCTQILTHTKNCTYIKRYIYHSLNVIVSVVSDYESLVTNILRVFVIKVVYIYMILKEKPEIPKWHKHSLPWKKGW